MTNANNEKVLAPCVGLEVYVVERSGWHNKEYIDTVEKVTAATATVRGIVYRKPRGEYANLKRWRHGDAGYIEALTTEKRAQVLEAAAARKLEAKLLTLRDEVRVAASRSCSVTSLETALYLLTQKEREDSLTVKEREDSDEDA